MLQELKERLKGKIAILGIGNPLRSDDAFGSLLASRIKGKTVYTVYDAGASPENYLGKIVKDKPDTLLIVDAADFGGSPGELKIQDAAAIATANLFSTHNASLELLINYLQSHLALDIIILLAQSKSIALGDKLSPELDQALGRLEECLVE